MSEKDLLIGLAAALFFIAVYAVIMFLAQKYGG